MQNTPQISVIIPTLNEEKLIIQTLGQFTEQLKEKFKIEIIISDGGSTDNTLKLLTGIVDKVVTAEPGIKQNIPQEEIQEQKRQAANSFISSTLIQ